MTTKKEGETKATRKKKSTHDVELVRSNDDLRRLYEAPGAEESLSDLRSRAHAHPLEVNESEERLRALVDTAVDAIITIDHRGIIQSFNLTAERMFGFSQEEAIGENVSLLMPSPYREEHDGYIARYLETGEARIIGIGREVEARRKDGRTFPVDLSVSEVGHLGLFTGIIRDISERKRAESALDESEKRLRGLTARLLTVQEEERRHISRELHDVVGQKLTLLRMYIDQLDAPPRTPSADGYPPAKLDRLREIVDSLAGNIRDLSHQLHPSAVEHLGLVVALRKECNMVAKTAAIAIDFHAGDDFPRRPPMGQALCLYRVAQEALQNAVKHSGAHRVDVSLESVGDGIQLSVVDSGEGFEIGAERSSGGLGLVSMEERARAVDGTLDVESKLGEGTRVRCWVPLPEETDVE